ncbi:TonB-dependent siderophore receptor [Methylobrevis albus]|uniref:TonB-dependent siderophore receptor n=1 Tax=Methylobrevis albus TaxID=2793297 RepID=A0A931MYE9_9HYPH|nr:TonB-dependent siderophore receptor [Methylobrevis albus]MBH0238342.1 TonB-dependent siderophore receptor [Methylobrevis albus]
MPLKSASARRSALLAGSAVLALVAAAPALAQQADETIELEAIVVEGGAGSATGPVDGYVAGATATGSKTATPVEEIPQSVSVIGREEIDDLGAQKVDEALRYTPGVYAQPFGPDSDTNWLFIRGFQATQSGVYQDGLQLYSYAFGGFYTDSYTLERIEVLRGAASVLYGGSNPGGLVNLVSKRADGERRREAEVGINDAGTAYFGFDVGDQAGETVDWRVVGRLLGGDGYSDYQDEFRGVVSPTVTWRPNEDTALTILANYTYMDQTHGGGGFLPYVGTVVDAPFGRIDPDANFTEPDIDLYERRQGSIGYEIEHKLTDDWTVRQNARYGHSELHEISVYPYGYLGYALTPQDPDNQLTRINFEHQTTVDTFLVDNQLEGRVDTGPLEHRLLFGADYKWFNIDQMQATGASTPISATNPVYGGEQGPRSAYIDQDLVQQQLGVYVQDQLRFGDGFIVTLNGRYDFVDTDATGTPSYSGSDGEFSWRAGLAYEFDNGVTPYASASSFFNPLIGSSAAAGFFQPETGQQYEAGIKYAPTWFDGLFTLAVFDLTRQNVVTGPFLAETQIGEVNSRGFEFEAKANLTEQLKLTAALTAFDLEITEDADASIIGNTPYIVPERQASLALDYTFGSEAGRFEGVTLGAGVRFVGSTFADNANTLEVPSATVFDAKLGYERDNWGVAVNVTNLFDKEYVASCQTAYACSYAEGRAVKFSAHMRW